ncbi:PAS domain S-box protein [Massilia sp. Leaf139]|uniref:sensor domain-containing diguanylate cyclase n=1 Tax=Massilia sp. Leaf139 TaxID=1736272 RepID=UPI0006F28A25|nr:PAS domain S-box protein [Massilia sp. Leaf139]KQQ86889.1 diguanylate cyclase [Massilia sp. Leaf139]
MPAARIPADELERLQLLEALDLLDTEEEEVFDRITRLVSRLLKVPIALFSLVDENRQWFKSHVGLDVRETPREMAFCAHALLDDQPLVVPDATSDERFANNPLVTGAPNIRFYAGVPVRTSGGLAIGTLCAIDERPRMLTADELCILIDLADIVQKEVQYRERLAVAGRQMLRSEAVLSASEARFRSIFDLASIGIALVSPTGGWLSANGTLSRMLGYAPEELQRLTFQQVTHPDDLDADLDLLRKLGTGELDQYQLEKRYIRKGGGIVWVNLNVSRKLNEAGEIEYYISVIQDIGAQKEAEHALHALHQDLEARVATRTLELHERELELRSVIDNANDAYIGLDEAGIVTVWNRAAEQTFGYTALEAIGAPLDRLIIPESLTGAHREGMFRYVTTGNSTVLGRRIEVPAVRKDGSPLMVELRMNVLELKGQKMFSAFLHDITERKEAEARREYETRHDMLTNLLNRRALLETLPIAQMRAARTGKSMALLFIDLDGFKAVNDDFGHDAGDTVLRAVATRLQEVIRKTDSAFRLAGDEFTVLLEAMSDTFMDARQVAHKIIAELGRPVAIAGASANVAASIGVAVFRPDDSASAEELLREADRQMYAAKRAGKGQVFPRP